MYQLWDKYQKEMQNNNSCNIFTPMIYSLLISSLLYVIAGVLSQLFVQIGKSVYACPLYNPEEHAVFPPWKHHQCPKIVQSQRPLSLANGLMVLFSQSLGIIFHFIQLWAQKRKQRKVMLLHARGQKLDEPIPIVPKHSWKTYAYVGFPELINYLLAIPTDLTQVYGSSIAKDLGGVFAIAFVVLFTKLILKRVLKSEQVVAICAACAAACIAGSASVAVYTIINPPETSSKVWISVLLTVIYQLIYSLEIVSEDMLLTSLNVSPLQLIGMEGIWGLVLICACGIPMQICVASKSILQFNYDMKNYFYMTADRPEILACTLLSILSQFLLGYGLFEMQKEAKCVFRTILERSVILCSGLVNLLIDGLASENQVYGVQWASDNWLLVPSLLMYLLAMLVYMKVVVFKSKQYLQVDTLVDTQKQLVINRSNEEQLYTE